MGRLLVSRTVVTRLCVTPWVMVPFVAPFAKVTLIDFGGQVEKKPADEAEPADKTVISVVPGCAAVIWLVSLLMLATIGEPTR